MGIRQSALQRLRKNSISAKDIASQAWCEKQMELYISTPMPETVAMKKGSAFHETQKSEVFVPLSVPPVTWPDKFYKSAYENYTSLSSLVEKGTCRELKVYGSINGFKISGQVDELRIDAGKVVVVEDKTVGNIANITEARLRPDKIQASLYRKLISDIRKKSYTMANFSSEYSIDNMSLSKEFIQGLESIGIKKELQSPKAIYQKMFEAMLSIPEISENLELRYFNNKTGELLSNIKITYDETMLSAWLQKSMAYWSGEREAEPVQESENWKCRRCRFFGKECTAWSGKIGNVM